MSALSLSESVLSSSPHCGNRVMTGPMVSSSLSSRLLHQHARLAKGGYPGSTGGEQRCVLKISRTSSISCESSRHLMSPPRAFHLDVA